MITIKYEEYWNDFKRTHYTKRFADLKELEEWIFGQMKGDYSNKENGWLRMYWPTRASRMEFSPSSRDAHYWIHEIDNELGIMFTDGKYTSGQEHINQTILDFFAKGKERQYAPKFNFVD